MILFTKRPDRNHVNNSALVSKWVCSRHPILFELHRQDLPLISVSAGATGITVLKTVYDPTTVAEISAGDWVYFESNINPATNTAGNYGVKAQVISVTNNAPNYYTILVSYQAESAITNGGFLNILSRTNYYAVSTIYLTDALTGKVYPVLAKLKPGNDGRMRLDASDFINGYLSKDLVTITPINQADKRVYGKFYIGYSERWTGYSDTETIDSAGDYYFVDAASELQSTYGQNLMEYLTHGVDVSPKPKFLTDFNVPTYWPGYPFDLSVIMNNSETYGITREEDQFDGAGNSLANTSFSLNLSDQPAVHRMRLSGSFASGTKYIEVYLKANSIVQRSYYDNYYHASGYHETVPPSSGSLTAYEMTERKKVKIGEPCGRNPVYIRWRNKKGGWDSWLFEGNQIINEDAKTEGEFLNEPDELSTANVRSVITDTKHTKRITCGATVSKEDVQGIAGIEASPAIYLLVDAGSDKWLRMKSVQRGFQYQTKGATADITVQLEYPELYTVSN